MASACQNCGTTFEDAAEYYAHVNEAHPAPAVAKNTAPNLDDPPPPEVDPLIDKFVRGLIAESVQFGFAELQHAISSLFQRVDRIEQHPALQPPVPADPKPHPAVSQSAGLTVLPAPKP